jgi:endonuclease YncB( thermonuclease family)
MGILRVRGTIDITQFWPAGSSDADTTKVKVTVGTGSFAYAENGRTFKVTNVFDDARVVGKSREPVIKNNKITVRLQGIDAPELHYRAGALPRSDAISDEQRRQFNQLNRTERRQHWAESATLALKNKLARIGDSEIECEVLSLVDHPYELVDTYGRVVANIRVGRRADLDINLWLAEEGWVVPTFYSSMTEAEIQALLAAMRKGKRKGRVVTAITGDTGAFDDSLVYRPHGQPEDDKGPVLMPKLFRRQVAYQLQKRAGIVGGSFKAFLTASPDYCFTIDDFLETTVHSATPRTLDEFLEGHTFTPAPHELVFKEKFSSVVDARGHRIEEF